MRRPYVLHNVVEASLLTRRLLDDHIGALIPGGDALMAPGFDLSKVRSKRHFLYSWIGTSGFDPQ